VCHARQTVHGKWCALPAGSIKKGFSFLNVFVIAIDVDHVGIGDGVPASNFLIFGIYFRVLLLKGW